MQPSRALILFGFLLTMLFALGVAVEARAVDINENVKFYSDDGETGDLFGYTMDTDGTSIAVGGRDIMDGSLKTGGAYMFDVAGNQLKRLSCNETLADGDRFGAKVLVQDDLAFVVAQNLDVTVGMETIIDAGTIFIFNRNEGGTNNWGQVGKITATHPDTGTAGCQFGLRLVDVVRHHHEHAAGRCPKRIDHRGRHYYLESRRGLFLRQGRRRHGQLGPDRASPGERFFGRRPTSAKSPSKGPRRPSAPTSPARSTSSRTTGLGNWTETNIIEGEADTRFGTGTSLSGDTLLVGAYLADVDEESEPARRSSSTATKGARTTGARWPN